MVMEVESSTRGMAGLVIDALVAGGVGTKIEIDIPADEDRVVVQRRFIVAAYDRGIRVSTQSVGVAELRLTYLGARDSKPVVVAPVAAFVRPGCCVPCALLPMNPIHIKAVSSEEGVNMCGRHHIDYHKGFLAPAFWQRVREFAERQAAVGGKVVAA